MSKKPKNANKAKKAKMTTRVRMYRQGLGDCFLITFDVGGSEKHVLIDCGTLGATTTGVKLGDVVKDIRTTTGDRLALLVATHEHWDHVRAFDEQLAEIKKIKVDHVWMAWTECPDDPLAQAIAERKKDLGTALTAAAKVLSNSSDPHSREAGLGVRDVLGFFGDDVFGAAKFSETVNDAMHFVRTGTGAKVRFCKPGDGPLEETWLPGFRCYVLGPPYSEAALNDTGEKGSSELYGLIARLNAGTGFRVAGCPPAKWAESATLEERTAFIQSLPFDQRFRIESDSARTREPFARRYFANAESWRRVDEDWLSPASDLALQLDNVTNNTSLVLAFERISDGKVLLFPADAQQGNWLSWQDSALKWTVKGSGPDRTVKAKDLLAKTVFYKVGHHASHNATAKAAGLEMMTSADDLTAFIPVDRQVALGRNPQGSWKMPAVALYRRLLEQCQGRVFRSDIGWAADANSAANTAVESAFVGMATATEWTDWAKAQQKASHVTFTKLYVDYLLK